MKRILLTGIVIFGFTGISYAQNGVGIGTNTPVEKLDVDGAIKLGNTTTTNAGTIRWTGTAFEGYDGSAWVILSGGTASNNWTVSANDIYNANIGNVGVGVMSPQQKLDVAGAINLGTTTAASAGAIRWTGTDFEGYDGSAWVSLTGLGTSNGAFETASNVTSNSVGDPTTDDFVFGSTQLDNQSGAADDDKFFFDKSKGAFRAGSVTGSQWNDANIGLRSIAMGRNAQASGASAVSLGSHNSASGGSSTAMGGQTTASGQDATSMGRLTTASGNNSTAMGVATTAPSYAETVVGQYNTNYSPSSTGAWNNNDRLFVVGNGASSGALSNALTISKDGTMNINDAYDMPTTDGTVGQVMTTDGSGGVTWQDAAGGAGAL